MALGMTVSELGERMTLAEYHQWCEYLSLEPVLEERVDLAGAVVASAVANVNRARGAKPYPIDDFMFVANGIRDHYENKKSSTSEQADIEAATQLKMFILRMGGKVP